MFPTRTASCCPAPSAKCISGRTSTRRKSPFRSMPCCSAGRPAGCGRRQRQQGAAAAHHHRTRLRHDAGDSRRRRREGSHHRQSRPIRLEERPEGECRSRTAGRQAVMKRLNLGGRESWRQRSAGRLRGRPELQAPSRAGSDAYKTQAPWRVAAPKGLAFPKAHGGRSSTTPS